MRAVVGVEGRAFSRRCLGRNALSAPPVCSPSALTSIEPPTGLRSAWPWPGPTTRLRGIGSLTPATLLRRSGRRGGGQGPVGGGRPDESRARRVDAVSAREGER